MECHRADLGGVSFSTELETSASDHQLPAGVAELAARSATNSRCARPSGSASSSLISALLSTLQLRHLSPSAWPGSAGGRPPDVASSHHVAPTPRAAVRDTRALDVSPLCSALSSAAVAAYPTKAKTSHCRRLLLAPRPLSFRTTYEMASRDCPRRRRHRKRPGSRRASGPARRCSERSAGPGAAGRVSGSRRGVVQPTGIDSPS